MPVVGVADQYMILMAITMLFTVLSLAYNDSKTLSVLAGIAWITTSIGHFAVGDQTSALTISLSWFFLGLGIIFIVKTILKAIKMMETDRWGTEI